MPGAARGRRGTNRTPLAAGGRGGRAGETGSREQPREKDHRAFVLQKSRGPERLAVQTPQRRRMRGPQAGRKRETSTTSPVPDASARAILRSFRRAPQSIRLRRPDTGLMRRGEKQAANRTPEFFGGFSREIPASRASAPRASGPQNPLVVGGFAESLLVVTSPDKVMTVVGVGDGERRGRPHAHCRAADFFPPETAREGVGRSSVGTICPVIRAAVRSVPRGLLPRPVRLQWAAGPFP